MATLDYTTLATPYMLGFYLLVGPEQSQTTFSSTSSFNQRTSITLQHRTALLAAATYTIRLYGYAPVSVPGQVAAVTRCNIASLTNIS